MKKCKICRLQEQDRLLIEKLLKNEGHFRKVTPLTLEQVNYLLFLLFGKKCSRWTMAKHRDHMEMEEDAEEEE